jgi:hypothetical protein
MKAYRLTKKFTSSRKPKSEFKILLQNSCKMLARSSLSLAWFKLKSCQPRLRDDATDCTADEANPSTKLEHAAKYSTMQADGFISADDMLARDVNISLICYMAQLKDRRGVTRQDACCFPDRNVLFV